MKKIIATLNKPIKLWLDDIEKGALAQAEHLAALPFVFKHIAIMPDAHQGYGMPIGAVMATKDVIVPNAVGVDIGCGMCAVKTSLVNPDQNTLKKIMKGIREKIPVGYKHHLKKQEETNMPSGFNIAHLKVISQEYYSALRQIGTLGGGNHFIEIQRGSDGYVWLMIHSGSRNLGFKVAKYYNDLAISLNRKWHYPVPEKWQLAFLPAESSEGQEYFSEMQYCVEFALANRKLMMERVKQCLTDVVGHTDFGEMINIAHNFAAIENHFHASVIVHRKGATRAFQNQLGIIPGSQGTSSYIVRGKGEPESFMSCSHGAGRRLGRKQALRELNFNEQKKILDDAGIIHGLRSKKDLDEAPGSYKDIDSVMANQSDLITIEEKLRPLAVVKG